MLAVTYSVIRIGETWTVVCSHGAESTTHADRFAALRAAEQAALTLWKEQSVASRVVVSEDDGQWVPVAEFGQLLG